MMQNMKHHSYQAGTDGTRVWFGYESGNIGYLIVLWFQLAFRRSGRSFPSSLQHLMCSRCFMIRRNGLLELAAGQHLKLSEQWAGPERSRASSIIMEPASNMRAFQSRLRGATSNVYPRVCSHHTEHKTATHKQPPASNGAAGICWSRRHRGSVAMWL